MGRPLTAVIHSGPHCAFCRYSQAQRKDFICKLALPMKAETCPSFKDSRKPSSNAQPFYVQRGEA